MNATSYAILHVVFGAIAVFLAICWIIFPFIVSSKCNVLIPVGRAILVELRKNAETTERIRSAQNETNRGIQYLVDTAALAHRADAAREEIEA